MMQSINDCSTLFCDYSELGQAEMLLGKCPCSLDLNFFLQKRRIPDIAFYREAPSHDNGKNGVVSLYGKLTQSRLPAPPPYCAMHLLVVLRNECCHLYSGHARSPPFFLAYNWMPTGINLCNRCPVPALNILSYRVRLPCRSLFPGFLDRCYYPSYLNNHALLLETVSCALFWLMPPCGFLFTIFLQTVAT